jgi:hypothetical protein
MNVYTTATSLKLVDVSAMGLSLPTGTSCDWSVTAQPGTSVDDFAKQGGTAAHGNPGVIDTSYVSAPAVTITTQ